MLEQHEICAGLFHGFDHRAWVTGDAEDRLSLLPAAQEHILAQEDGKARLLQVVTELSAAFALSVPADEALAIRDDVGSSRPSVPSSPRASRASGRLTSSSTTRSARS